jgi:hypothetical protein
MTVELSLPAQAKQNVDKHRLTEIIFAISWFSEFLCKTFKTFLGRAKETYAFQVWKSVALLVVYSICKIHLVRKERRLRCHKRNNWSLKGT